ncbi:MAG TPA: SdrD B-like domain-containing protein [Blastocatellia bacterium]|nr:SdrD B-like domain-containing protein [Blastocatellia bacterium]
MPGVGVNLVQEDGTIIKTTQTNAQGQFEFTGVKPGRYLLKLKNDIKGTTAHSSRDAATGQASGKLQSEAPDDKVAEARGVNTSRSNIKNQKAAPTTDDTNTSDTTPQNKAGVSTSRSNVRTKSAAQLNVLEEEEVIVVELASEVTPDSKRTHVVPHVFEQKGLMVNVPTDGHLSGTILKTRHDTVKNSINNIR